MEATEPWVYRNIFRPTSLSITPTVDANKDGDYTVSEVGHVNGALAVGTTPYNWQALPYKTETSTGLTTNSISWTTKNPYGKDVQLNLFSSPSSEILIEKNVGRIGGYDAPSEVFSPVVWFRTPAASAEYRVTALLSRYSGEEAKTAQEIPVTGTGHAMNVHSSSTDDSIYTGKGISSFGMFATNADSVFIRKEGDITEFTLLEGSFLKENNENLVSISSNVDYVTYKREGTTIKFNVRGHSTVDIQLYNITPESILRDGSLYTNWVMQNNNTILKISTDLSEHEFEIVTTPVTKMNQAPVLDPIGNKTVSSGSLLDFTVSALDPDSTPLEYSVSGLPANATFNLTTRSFAWIPTISQVGTYNVTFRVTDGSFHDTESVTITVTAVNQPPVLDPIGNKTVSSGSLLNFTVSATDPDSCGLVYSVSNLPAPSTSGLATGLLAWIPDCTHTIFQFLTIAGIAADPDSNNLTYAASSMPASATFNPETRSFAWVPDSAQVGTYTITFQVTDGSLTDTESIVINVTAVNQPPELDPIGNKTVSSGSLLNFTVSATDPDSCGLEYSASSLPANATFNITTRSFAWIPTISQAGTYNVTFQVTDGSLTDTESVIINVTAVNQAPALDPIGNKIVSSGSLLDFTVSATDPDRYCPGIFCI